MTVDRALRLLGIGAASVEALAVDERGALRADALRAALDAGERADDRRRPGRQRQHGRRSTRSPTCAPPRARPARGCTSTARSACGRRPARRAARSSPASSRPTRGRPTRTSGSTSRSTAGSPPSATARPTAPRCRCARPTSSQDPDGPREPMDWTPEFSRRARAVPVYATLRALGRSGVAELVDRLCDCAERFAERLAAADGFDVLAQDLNQVLAARRRRRRAHARHARRRAGRRDVLAERDDVARAQLHPHLGLELADDARGRRPLGRRRSSPTGARSTSGSAASARARGGRGAAWGGGGWRAT